MDSIKPNINQAKDKMASNVKSDIQRFDDTYHMVKDRVSEGADEAKSLYADFTSMAREKGEKAVSATRDFAKENPLAVVWGAAAIGLAVGYLLTRSKRH